MAAHPASALAPLSEHQAERSAALVKPCVSSKGAAARWMWRAAMVTSPSAVPV